MTKPRITIVGLGLIGASIGLGLGQEKRTFEIVGHDKNHQAVGKAKKLKAVDKSEWNLISACDGADLVILALPVMGVRDTLKALAGELKPGCVVMDTANAKLPVLAWAEELLGDSVHFVGTNPIISAEEGGGPAARADLFQKAIWAICPSPTTHPDAVQTVADLVNRLGANPLFLDAAEHDGMLAAVDHLPAVVSTALIASLIGQPSWREMRKLAGGQFENTTRLVATDSQVFRDAALVNQENLTRWIDSFIEHLRSWRDLIASGDEEALGQAFEGALDGRTLWERQRQQGRWDEGEPDMPERQGALTTLMGFGGLSSRLARIKDRDQR